MPLGPRKAVEAGRDVCLDDGAVVALILGELAAGQLHRACCRLPSDIDVLLVQSTWSSPLGRSGLLDWTAFPCGHPANRLLPVDSAIGYPLGAAVKRQ